ncbi:PREDICTED: glutathione S-transferase T3-like [Brassica oleracea var. oleracea]|uniref:glutathione S-transferase T3-like n=1 Tax=Brassica oleracea var. oleracea TaxID=109376 RepID=UPI0006A756EF|nr:PREDICTED: glutathione S-transferase T3-like [Brassica oleracea var. oleracea]
MNDKLFRCIDRDPLELVRYAESECQAWHNTKEIISPPLQGQPGEEIQALSLGNICMVDGSWTSIAQFSGMGWIWKDSMGKIQLMGSRNLMRRETPLYSELEALRWAMESMIQHSNCCVDPRNKKKEPQSNGLQSRAIQDDVPLFGSQGAEASSYPDDSSAERRELRLWTPVEDIVLISSWLNTSKDPVVGNEQRSGTFWKSIAAYFAASPKVAVSEQRDANHCKQRWHKINDQVNKFCGAIEAATREKTSGQNENDELRNDQKWCGLKSEGSSKRRKYQEGSQSESSAANETRTDEEERPPGVKAAKGKKTKVEGKDRISEFQTMWSIKQQDLVIKERLSKMRLLDSLLAKKEPLADYEEALKKKLINELLSR